MKKVLIILVILAIGYCIGFTFGRYDVYMCVDKHIRTLNYKTAYYSEKNIAGASLELNHLFFSNEDNDYWFDVIINTKEYAKLDSALGGNWEDFYMYETPIMWESITYKPDYSY